MSNTPSVVNASVCTALVRGRIFSRRVQQTKNGRQHVTVLKLPAVDEFTAPQSIELRSKGALGDVGDMFAGKVQLGGYGRSYQADDGEGGKVTVQTADNSLTVVE